ncbi:hypothetical protein OAQ37_05660 [Alphaproteobacteria bacterium]|nr:hypothetical protein [Alphaproteobacteria bacterium]
MMTVGRKICFISEISPSPKIKFIKAGAIGILDDANDRVVAGQTFADSHPHRDRLQPHDLPHLDNQFRGKES